MTLNRQWLAPLLLVAASLAGCGGGGEEGSGEETVGATTSGEKGTTATAPGAPAATSATATAPASGAVLQTQEVSDVAGMAVEVTEATREDGVLTIKLRVRNTGTAEAYKNFETEHGNYSYFYVTAENQKYFILKDSEGAPLAPRYLTASLDPGQTMTWWGKYPAPPAGVTEFDFVMVDVPPFENIPITDR